MHCDLLCFDKFLVALLQFLNSVILFSLPMDTLSPGHVRFGAFGTRLQHRRTASIEAPDLDNPGPNHKVLFREQVFQVLRMLVEREGKMSPARRSK